MCLCPYNNLSNSFCTQCATNNCMYLLAEILTYICMHVHMYRTLFTLANAEDNLRYRDLLITQ